MSDSEPVIVTFDCEAPQNYPRGNVYRAIVEIEIGATVKDYVGDTAFDSTIRLRVGENVFADRMVIYGGYLRHFARELQKLYDDLQGSARLADWDSDVHLCFTVVDRTHGQIALGGRLTPVVFDTSVASEERFVSGISLGRQGIVIAFEGLSLDQSYLKAPMSDLKRFIDGHSAECEMTGGYPPA